MTKRVIEAKLALDDIRSGMSDVDLMLKYKLSSKGLQSLLGKLGQAGLLKHINARELQRDIRAGLNDEQLMKKYQLSAKGLEAILKQMDRMGLLQIPLEEDNLPTKIFIRVSEIVKDMRSGMDRVELMEKYHLSARGLTRVSMMLVSSGALTWKEIHEDIRTGYGEHVAGKIRSQRRYSVGFGVPVYDIDHPERLGKLHDVSEAGMGIQGIEAAIGETKTLVISEDKFGEYSTFVLDAKCRWVGAGPDGPVAGFEISHLSVGSMAELNLLFELVRLPYRNRSTSI
jgi:Mor family transcriptional regulator